MDIHREIIPKKNMRFVPVDLIPDVDLRQIPVEVQMLNDYGTEIVPGDLQAGPYRSVLCDLNL